MTIFDLPKNCEICEAECQPQHVALGLNTWRFPCPRCSDFAIASSYLITFRAALIGKPHRRGALSGFLRHRELREALPVAFAAEKSETQPWVFTIEDALASVPRNPGEVQDALLLAVAHEIGAPGGRMPIGESETPLAYSLKYEDLDWHVQQLLARGLLQHAKSPFPKEYNLSHAGWALVDDLDRGATVDLTQAFVAMWFDASMDAAYDDGIAPAISGAGFRPYRIKDVEHNNKICDEILAEIRRSRFVVAEFTGNRGGVYFEAGFAMGLGRPVVWIVKDADLPKVHFDTNHFNHITWTTVEELRTKLQRRIEATIPRPTKA